MKANEAQTDYPVQFKDKIDEYLWKEHHILGGCCSSIESVKYAVAREVAEKLADVFIEKAYEWIETHINDYLVKGRDIDYMFDDFRKAVEEYGKEG